MLPAPFLRPGANNVFFNFANFVGIKDRLLPRGKGVISRNPHWLSFMLNGLQAWLYFGDKGNEQRDDSLAFMELLLE